MQKGGGNLSFDYTWVINKNNFSAQVFYEIHE